MKSFLTFGCWNKGLCESNLRFKSNAFSSVANSIKQSVKANLIPNLEFMCVLGDNYYPTIVEDKKKILFYQEMASGFECLESVAADLNAPVDVLIGNHDIEDMKKISLHPNPSL